MAARRERAVTAVLAYEELRIRVRRVGAARYLVTANGPASAAEIIAVGGEPAALREQWERLITAELALAPMGEQHTVRQLRELGRGVFRLLFDGEGKAPEVAQSGTGCGAAGEGIGPRVGACVDAALDRAQRMRPPRGLRLRFDLPPELRDLPLEALCAPPGSPQQSLALNHGYSLVRSLPGGPLGQRLPDAADEPSLIRLLVACASPAGPAPLRVASEVAALRHHLPEVAVQTTVVERATRANLEAALAAHPDLPTAVVLIAHGAYDHEIGKGVVALETESGGVDRVPADLLSGILLKARRLRLVALNLCFGADSSPLEPFSGVAQALIGGGVPAVVAMRGMVSDASAGAFSPELLKGIAANRTVDESMAAARLHLSHQPDHTAVEWATPALFLHEECRHGWLFKAREVRDDDVGPGAVADPLREGADALRTFQSPVGHVGSAVLIGAARFQRDLGHWSQVQRILRTPTRSYADEQRRMCAEAAFELAWPEVEKLCELLAGERDTAGAAAQLAVVASRLPVPVPDCLAAEVAELERLAALVGQARAAEASADWATAISRYEEVLAARPAGLRDVTERLAAARDELHVARTCEAAERARRAGDWATAGRAYGAVLALRPGHGAATAWASYTEGRAAEAAEDWQAAESAYAACAELADAAARAAYARGRAAARDGDWPAAREAFTQAGPERGAWGAYAAGRAAEADGAWGAAAEGYAAADGFLDSGVRHLYARGRGAADAGDVVEALTSVSAAAARGWDTEPLLGELRHRVYEAALRAAESADWPTALGHVTLLPPGYRAAGVLLLYVQGQLAASAGDWAGAAEAFGEATEGHGPGPTGDAPHLRVYALGRLCQERGRWAEALAHFAGLPSELADVPDRVLYSRGRAADERGEWTGVIDGFGRLPDTYADGEVGVRRRYARARVAADLRADWPAVLSLLTGVPDAAREGAVAALRRKAEGRQAEAAGDWASACEIHARAFPDGPPDLPPASREPAPGDGLGATPDPAPDDPDATGRGDAPDAGHDTAPGRSPSPASHHDQHTTPATDDDVAPGLTRHTAPGRGPDSAPDTDRAPGAKRGTGPGRSPSPASNHDQHTTPATDDDVAPGLTRHTAPGRGPDSTPDTDRAPGAKRGTAPGRAPDLARDTGPGKGPDLTPPSAPDRNQHATSGTGLRGTPNAGRGVAPARYPSPTPAHSPHATSGTGPTGGPHAASGPDRDPHATPDTDPGGDSDPTPLDPAPGRTPLDEATHLYRYALARAHELAGRWTDALRLYQVMDERWADVGTRRRYVRARIDEDGAEGGEAWRRVVGAYEALERAEGHGMDVGVDVGVATRGRYARVRLAEAEGDWACVVAEADALGAYRDASAVAAYARGRLADAHQEWQRAADAFRGCPGYRDADAHLAYAQGRLLESAGKWSAAVAAYERARGVLGRADVRCRRLRRLLALLPWADGIISAPLVADPFALRDQAFPYLALRDAGVDPGASMDVVKNASYALLERGSMSWHERVALERLRLPGRRLRLDALLYRWHSREALRDALAGLSPDEGPGLLDALCERFPRDAPLLLLLARDREAAATEWERRLKQAPGDMAVVHGLAAARLWQAQELEQTGAWEHAVSAWEAALAYWATLLSDDEYWDGWRAERAACYERDLTHEDMASLRWELSQHLFGQLSAFEQRHTEQDQPQQAASYRALAGLLESELGGARVLKDVGGLPSVPGAGATLACGPRYLRLLRLQEPLGELVASLDAAAQRGKDPGEYAVRELRWAFSELARGFALSEVRKFGHALRALPALRTLSTLPKDCAGPASAAGHAEECAYCQDFLLRNPAYVQLPRRHARLLQDGVELAVHVRLALAKAALTRGDGGLDEALGHWRELVRVSRDAGMQARSKKAVIRTVLGRVEALTGEDGVQLGPCLDEAVTLVESATAVLHPLDRELLGQLHARLSALLSMRGVWRGYTRTKHGMRSDVYGAEADLRRALALNPESSHARDNLARALVFTLDERTYEVPARLELLHEALDLLDVGLGQALTHRYRETLGEALDEMEKLITRHLGVGGMGDLIRSDGQETPPDDDDLPFWAAELTAKAERALRGGEILWALHHLIRATRAEPTDSRIRQALLDAARRWLAELRPDRARSTTPRGTPETEAGGSVA
ncbi:CHAT domain-containing protein [Streptomyces sp. G5(2025)]|uniref:CHAT domain-containing protein n=1 Tax=Streptomyces sp. G5(2025) TaxID=3406628 RepID=UPI003C19CFD0